jgi:hypothetical protein
MYAPSLKLNRDETISRRQRQNVLTHKASEGFDDTIEEIFNKTAHKIV